MPTYTYTCTACNEVVEKRQSFSDAPLTTCEQCGGTLRKIIHPVGIVFKGSGWYSTDSRSKSATNGRTSSGDSDPASSSKDSSSKDGSAKETSAKESGSKDSSGSKESSSTKSDSASGIATASTNSTSSKESHKD